MHNPLFALHPPLPLHSSQLPIQSEDCVPCGELWHDISNPLHDWHVPHDQVAPLGRYESAGHDKLLPVHVSIASHAPAAGLHILSDFAGVCAHVCVPRLHVGSSHMPKLVPLQSESDIHSTQLPL